MMISGGMVYSVNPLLCRRVVNVVMFYVMHKLIVFYVFVMLYICDVRFMQSHVVTQMVLFTGFTMLINVIK